MTNRIIKSRTKIRSSRKYRKRDVRKNNSSKRRSRRSESTKCRNMTIRKMNKMKGGARSWDCKCHNPPKDGDGDGDGKVKEESHKISPPQLLSPAGVAAAAAAASTAAVSATTLTPPELSRQEIARLIAEQVLGQQTPDMLRLNVPSAALNAYTTLSSRPLPPPSSVPLSRPENISSILNRKMIDEKDGTYKIKYPNKLPKGFIDGDTILTINDEVASESNIHKLYDGTPGQTAVVTVRNNTGGTNSKHKRTITIQY